jgi:hypothetical protein
VSPQFWDVIRVVEPTVPNISKDDADHSFEMRITTPVMQQHIAGNMNPQLSTINFI